MNMSRILLFLAFVIASIAASGQCDLQVEIKANPGAEICLGESVQLTAVTNQEVEIPENCEIVTDVDCEVGSIPFTAGLDDGTTVNAQGASLPDMFGDINDGQLRTQIIYQADELIAEGFEGGKIKGLQFEIATILGGTDVPNLEIQIGCTSEDDFASTFITGLNTVFDKKAVTLTTGFNTFDFDRGFNWNGKDNIVVQVCMHAANGSPGNFKNYTRDQFLPFPAMRAAKKILSEADCDFNDNARNSNQRPNTRFLTCKPQLKDFTYTWNASPNLSDVNARDPFANPSVDETYTVSVYETANPACVATNTINIRVIDPGNFTPSANTPLCEGDALILNSNTAADGYLWIGPDGYTSTDANPVLNNVGLNNEGEYTVFVDVGFCKASASLEVDVESLLSSGNVLPDPVLCNNEPTLNLFNYLTGHDINGTSVWTDDDNSGVLAGNTLTPTNIPNAELPKTYRFTYTVGNSCGDQSSTVFITFNPAPNAGEDATISVCNLDDQTINLFSLLTGNPNTGGTWRDASGTGELQPGGTVNLQGFSAGIYSFYYKVTGPGACKADSAKVDVVVENYEIAGIGSNTRICKGETLDLNDFLSGSPAAGGEWQDNDNTGGLLNPATGIFNTTNVDPGTYTFDYFIDNPAPCPDETATVTVVVTKKPEIINPTTFCDASETFYEVRFEVRDGDPNTLTADITADGISYGYTLTQQGGIWIFTTDLIPEGEEVFIEISDADNCGSSSYNIRKRCGCATDAGVISKGPTVNICEGSFYTVNYLGGFIDDGDDIFEFILHDSPNSTIGNILARNRTGTFGFVPGVVEGTTYYISVVAGDTKPGTQEVDLDDDCLDVRDGQPVQFIVLPQPVLAVDPDTACIGANVRLEATNVPAGVNYRWEGPGVTSPNLAFDIFGLQASNVGVYDFIISKSICTDTFNIEVKAFTEPKVTVPSDFIVCADVLDSIPLKLENVPSGVARFQTSTFQLIDLPIVNGDNYLHRVFNADETYKLLSVTYPKGCTKVYNSNINISLEQAPDLSFELISDEIICSAADPKAQIQFSLNPSTAQGNLIYEVNGFQFPDRPLVGNDSILAVSAINAGENTFKIRRYLSFPKACSYALNFGEVSFYNYEEPQVSFDVNNNKICRGDLAFIPISVNAADSISIIYSINGVSYTISTLNDTLLPIQESLDFTFSIDSVFYKGGNGCGKFIGLSQDFEVKDPINFNVTVVKNNCAGQAQGKLLLSAGGDNTKFSLDGSTYFERESFDNLPSGDYTVFAKAESGCISVRNVQIENKSNIELDVNFAPTTCGNNNGSLSVTANLGSEPYHIFVNGGEINNGGTLNNLSSKEYYIYAYDNLACEVRDTLFIEPSTGVDFSFTVNGPLTCDFPDAGKIFVTPTGGSGNYQYQINNQPPQSDSLFAGLYAQYYNLTVTDTQDGCVKKKRARIRPKVPFLLNAKILKDLECSYSNDGRIQAITEQNGTTYLYSLDGNNYNTQSLFSNVGQGQFTLFAKELDGCRREQDFSFKMEAPEPVVGEVIYTEDLECWNGEDGTIALSGSGGNGAPYSYKIAGSGGGFQGTPIFENLGQGIHPMVIRDAKTCTDTLLVRLNGPDTVIISIQKLDSANGKLTIKVNVLNTFLQTLYSLDGVQYTTNSIFENVDPGNYTVYVKDQLGCESTYTFNLTLVGINEFEASVFKVFPNPFESNFQLQFDQGIPQDLSDLRLYNLQGKSINFELEKVSSKRIKIIAPDYLPSGLYLINYKGHNTRVMKY